MTIAAIALTLALQTGPSYKIGGDTVPVLIPTWKSPRPLDTIEVGGWKYGLRNGNLVAKSRQGFEWGDLPSVPSTSSGVKKQVLVNLVTRIDTLTDRGFWWQRQSSIYTDDFRGIKREVALFCHLVHVLSGGKTEIEPTWRVDETLRFVNQPSDLGQRYLETFINATSTKPAEGIGPFDSTLILQPEFSHRVTGLKFDGTPVANVPLYGYYDRARPGQLARALYNAWLAAPSEVSLTVPDPLGSGPLPLFEATDWQDSAWQKLPAGTETAQSDWQGATVATSKGILVRPEFADLVAAKLGRAAAWQSHGWVFFEAADAQSGQTDAVRFGLQPTVAPTSGLSSELAFTPGQAEQLQISGSLAIKTSADPDRGSVGELKEMSIRRHGWVQLLSGFDGSNLKIVELWIKPRGATWPLDLVVEGEGRTKVFRLFGAAPDGRASGRYSNSDAIMLDVKSDPTWQRVAVLHGLGKVDGVYLATPAIGEEWTQSGLPSLLLDDCAAKATATGELTPSTALVPAPNGNFDKATEAKGTADESALLKFLTDESDVVRLNAAMRFASMKNPAAVPALALVARHYNPRLAEAGAKALAFQGTEAALGALRYNFQNALGDFVKQFTADALPPINERKILSELSLALNARRPEARAATARALARQPFKEAWLVMLSFLGDTEPVVRAAAIESLPEKQPGTLARVIGFARNDGSDLVRAAAFRKLKEWGAPEAEEIVKDPSPRVRALASAAK